MVDRMALYPLAKRESTERLSWFEPRAIRQIFKGNAMHRITFRLITDITKTVFTSDSPYVPGVGDFVRLRLDQDRVILTRGKVTFVEREYRMTDVSEVFVIVEPIESIDPLHGIKY